MKKPRIKMLLFGLIIGLIALASLPVIFQERMIYFPFRYDENLRPEKAIPKFLPYTTTDGRKQWGALIEPAGFNDSATSTTLANGPRSYLVFNGNASTAMGMAEYYERLGAETGCRFYVVDYRGYGFNDGSPNEKGLVADALGAYDTMEKAGFFEGGVGVIGQSLGGGVAFAVAAERRVDRLITISTFTSIDDMTSLTPYSFFRPLLRNHFRNEERLKEFCKRAPEQRPREIILIHSKRDQVVPFSMGERLAACEYPDLRFLTHDYAGHGDTHEYLYQEIVGVLRGEKAEFARAREQPADR